MREQARFLALLALFVVVGVVLWRVLRVEVTSEVAPPVSGTVAEADDANDGPVRAERPLEGHVRDVAEEADAPERVARVVPESAPGRIAGWTVSPEGVAIVGAEVLVHNPNVKARRLRTGDEGMFVVDGLDETTYTVRATADHFNPRMHERIAPGGELLRIELTPLSAVEGRVRDARTGEYLKEYEVVYLPSPPGDENHWLNIVHSDQTAWQPINRESGRYRIEDVYSEQRFAVGARAAGYEATYVEVEPASHDSTVEAEDVLLLPEARIVGRVFGPDGAPLSDSQITVIENGHDHVMARSDADGSFEISGLRDGEVIVQARHEGLLRTDVAVVLTRGAVASVELHLTKGTEVSGRVSLDGEPVAGVRIEALKVGIFDDADARASAVSEDSGRYVMRGLAPGQWNLVAELPNSVERGGSELTASTVVTDQGAKVDFPFTTELGAIEGAILIDGVPAETAVVEVRPEENWQLRTYSTRYESGRYRIDEVIPERVRITVEARDGAGQAVNGSAVIDVPAGATVRQDFRINPAAAIAGRVVNADPKVTQVAIVMGTRMQPPSLSFEEALRLQGEFIKELTVAADGTFEITGLASGEYTLVGIASGGDVENFLDNIQLRFVPFRVPGSEEVIIQFE